MTASARRRGWTLLEVVVSLAIIGVVGGLALAALSQAREVASRVACQNNLKQIMTAVHMFHEQRRTLPPYASSGQITGSWFVHLLPFLDHASLYEEIRIPDDQLAVGMETTVLSEGIRDVHFALLMCPSDPTIYTDPDNGRTSYVGNWFALTDGTGKAYSRPHSFAHIIDGVSNTVFFAEAYSDCAGVPRLALMSNDYHNFGITPDGKPSDDPSYLPQDYTTFQVRPSLDSGPTGCHAWRAQTPHQAMMVAAGDGSIRAVSEGISAAAWKLALKPRDGQITIWE